MPQIAKAETLETCLKEFVDEFDTFVYTTPGVKILCETGTMLENFYDCSENYIIILLAGGQRLTVPRTSSFDCYSGDQPSPFTKSEN